MDTPGTTFLAMILLIRLAIGGLLLSSALGKITDHRGFTAGVRAYRILPDRVAPWFSWLLPWIELSLALLLLLGLYLPLAALSVSMLISCFTIAVVVNLRRGRTIACHCHGLAGNRSITWGTVARNVPLIGLSLWLGVAAPSATTGPGWLDRWKVDLGLVSSPGALFVLGCLVVVWWLTLALIEWVVAVHIQTAQLVEDHL